ncbi:cytochrome P450 [Rickenella mellea]|uniref:Cytochrome P450 n=1 Tax=Rickenella mellea TaxID=50990 RepID=A0A4Y7PKE8_9AGAM|nr:cytochrome P450 [Rickenella mellea]
MLLPDLLDFVPLHGSHFPASIAVVALGSLVLFAFIQRRGRPRNLKHPPGPRGYPFIGNLIEVAKAERPHLLFPEWSKNYGKMVHFSIFGFQSVIVSKLSIANDLLEKRGAIYSDRPNMILENDLLGWDAAMPTMRYGAQFRKHRRLSQALLNPNAARSYATMHEELASRLLASLSTQPEKFRDHILMQDNHYIFNHYYASSTIFRLTYDLDVTSDDEYLARLVHAAVRRSAEAYQASGALVDVFPSLKWFYTSYPDNAPFSGFKKVIADIRREVIKANGVPYDMAKDKIRDGTARTSLVNNAINGSGGIDKISAEDEHDIRGLAGILYGGTTATLTSFILAMVCNPDVQRKVQAEIDAVIPCDRLPNLDDRPNIPYLEAFLKELFRWASPLVIAIPHAVIQDDVYEGYFIPKGTSVIANICDMLNTCPRPSEFLPSRFIDGIDLGDVPSDPREVVFGFGRRRCPGLHVADNSIWTAVAQMLTSFEFLPEIVDGKEFFPPLRFGKEMTRHPEPFRCRIQPRNRR